MLGKLNEIENQILDVLENSDQVPTEQLRGVLSNLNCAVESANIAICQWNYKKGVGLANNQFYKNFGIDRNRPFREMYEALGSTFFEEDIVKTRLLEKDLADGLLDHFTIVIRQRSENGVRWWKHYFTLKDREKGEDEAMFTAVCWEITQEKEAIGQLQQSQQQLKSVNVQLSDTVKKLESAKREISEAYSLLELALRDNKTYNWEWNLKTGIISVDFPSLKKYATATTVPQFTLDKVLDIIYPDDISKIQMDRLSAENRVNSTFTIDIRVDYMGDGYNWFEFRGKVIDYDNSGQPLLLKGLALDIQKRKEDEMALVHMKEKAVAAEKLKSSFLTNITHELRTPLHAIVGFSDILATIDNKDERLKYLDAIKKNNDILLNLIGGVLETTDMEEGEELLSRDEVNIWEYLVELQQIYAMRIQGPVRLLFSSPYDNSRIVVDRSLLSQVFDNLFTNSINNTSSGQISFGYEVDSDRLKIVINDTGAGFDADCLNGVLNLNDNKLEDLTSNASLTISLCKGIVRKLKGDIQITSAPGEGSTYELTIPVELIAPNEPEPVNDESVEEADVESSNLPTILIAEDVVHNFLVMKTLLENRFNVIHAENGQVAIDLFDKHKPSFVFMDIKMPVMDGLEATRQIRRMSEDVPVVVLTAYAVRSLKKEASEAGCTDMLTKPTTAKQINATIRKYLK